MRVLFLENDDSFSWNVIDALPCNRADVAVCTHWHRYDCRNLVRSADVVVLGPGPKDPYRANLIATVQQIAAAKLPFLGICLGHQALGLAFGSRLRRVQPQHGKQSHVLFRESRLFPGIVGTYTVMRYHSLALSDIRSPLNVIAATPGGLPMAIEHAELPMAGLQFHPDSYGTPRGQEFLAAFFRALR